MTATNDLLDEFASAAGRLVSPSAVAMEVIRLTAHPQVDLRALKECLENDPALTTKILRVVNSSLFGLSRQVSDLNQALALLGTKPLKMLVLGFSLPEVLFANLAGDVLSRYWRTTLTKAVAARELSRLFCQRDGDEAFIAALLQDLGMLVLIQQLEEPYVKFLNQVFVNQGDLSSVERDVLGFSHTELTVRLLDRWGLPKTIVEAIAAVDSPASVDTLPTATREIASVLYHAQLLAGLLTGARDDVLPDLIKGRNRNDRRQPGRLTPSQLEPLMPILQEKVEQLADVLAVPLPTATEYAKLFADAQSQLATLADDAAVDVVRADRARASSAALEENLLAETASLSDAVARFNTMSAANESLQANDLPTINEPAVSNPALSAEASPLAARNNTTLVSTTEPSNGLATTFATDPDLAGRIAVAVAAARQSRSELSLLLVKLDGFADLIFRQGSQAGRTYDELLRSTCDSLDHPVSQSVTVGDGQCAVVLSDCDRCGAVHLADELLKTMRRISDPFSNETAPQQSVSIGVACVGVPPKNFLPSDLIEAAERCLYAAQISGGDSLKSIGIL